MRKGILRWIMSVMLLLIAGVITAQSGIRVVVVNEFQNIRVSPALGATVIDTVEAGYVFDTIDARSGDNQWLRIQYQLLFSYLPCSSCTMRHKGTTGSPKSQINYYNFWTF